MEKSDELARFYGVDGDELHLVFNFPFITAPLDAEPLRSPRRGDRGPAAELRVAGVDRLEPRHVAVGDPLGR